MFLLPVWKSTRPSRRDGDATSEDDTAGYFHFPELCLRPVDATGSRPPGTLALHAAVALPAGTLIPVFGHVTEYAPSLGPMLSWLARTRIAPVSGVAIDGNPMYNPVVVGLDVPMPFAQACNQPVVGSRGLAIVAPYVREPPQHAGWSTNAHIRAAPGARADEWDGTTAFAPLSTWLREGAHQDRVRAAIGWQGDISALPLAVLVLDDDVGEGEPIFALINHFCYLGRPSDYTFYQIPFLAVGTAVRTFFEAVPCVIKCLRGLLAAAPLLDTEVSAARTARDVGVVELDPESDDDSEGGNGKAKANAAVTVTNEEAVVRAAAIRRALSDAVDPHNAVSVDMIRRLLRELVPVLQRYAAGHRTGIVLPVVETTAVHTNVGVRSTGLNVPTVTVVAMPAITPVNPVRNLRTPLAPKRDRADKPDRSTSGRKRAMPSPLPPVGGLQDDDGLLDGQGSLPLDFLDDQDDVFVLSPQIRGFEAV